MDIVFDLTAIYDHLTGIERFAINISKNIIIQHPENNYILVFKNEIHKDFLEIAELPYIQADVLQECHKFLFHQVRLLKYLYANKADRYVFLSFVSPLLFRNKNIINTIHDISVWDCPSTRKKHIVLYGRLGKRNAVKVSKRIITVSDFCKKRIERFFHVNSEMVSVVYNGVSSQFFNTLSLSEDEMINLKRKYSLPNKYLLCLSTLEPRKNMKLLIDAFRQLIQEVDLDFDLVLAGRKGWKLEQVIGKGELDSRVHLTGFIDDDDLPYIYKEASVFVFPSLYEGFGIPVIEAMSQGTIVIASNSSSLPEVIGDAGILFENNSLDALKSAIKEFLAMDSERLSNLREKGFNQFKKFNWAEEAEKFYCAIL